MSQVSTKLLVLKKQHSTFNIATLDLEPQTSNLEPNLEPFLLLSLLHRIDTTSRCKILFLFEHLEFTRR